jgi:hypothetical protein
VSLHIGINPFRRWRLGYGTCSWRGYRVSRWGLSLRVCDFFGPWMVVVIGPRCWTFRGIERQAARRVA